MDEVMLERHIAQSSGRHGADAEDVASAAGIKIAKLNAKRTAPRSEGAVVAWATQKAAVSEHRKNKARTRKHREYADTMQHLGRHISNDDPAFGLLIEDVCHFLRDEPEAMLMMGELMNGDVTMEEIIESELFGSRPTVYRLAILITDAVQQAC